uniref:F-box associated beta-propeller type 1 domain-containing protein n=1 Tax=Tanacetum cinerariifolium TaxID=118510 RepID=A0A699QJR9_TANCI|nr:hypothetical protein [Tanacetum cinerariifolium]
MPLGNSFVGFSVCADTSDIKIVKINVLETPGVHWEVELFTLSSRSWKRLSINPLFELCHLTSKHIFIDGLIYWDGFHKPSLDDEPKTHFIVSFDLKKEEFGEVDICQQERTNISNNPYSLSVIASPFFQSRSYLTI